jgi:hypothetical protein
VDVSLSLRDRNSLGLGHIPQYSGQMHVGQLILHALVHGPHVTCLASIVSVVVASQAYLGSGSVSMKPQ